MDGARIISVCSQKGGSGKSAITIWLANSLAREGKRVLVLDADGQRTLTKLRYQESQQRDLPPGHCEVMATDEVARVLEDCYERYDMIFLDLPRMTGPDQAVLALTFCDSILVPVRLGDSDVISAFEFIKAARKMGELRRQKGLRFLLYGVQNFRKPRQRENGLIDYYANLLNVPLFTHALPDRADFMRMGTLDVPSDFLTTAQAFNPFFTEFKERFRIP